MGPWIKFSFQPTENLSSILVYLNTFNLLRLNLTSQDLSKDETLGQQTMKTTKYEISFLTTIITFIFLQSINSAQSQPSTIGYNCTASETSANSCQTYAFFRANAPAFLDLASVGDLFSVSRVMISEPSNITYPNSTLLPDQSLFVPITCSCNKVNSSITISYAALNYTIKSGDTFYLVSTMKYQNLTTYQSVEVVNPTFEPTRLNVGDVITFPIFCKCPDNSSAQQGNSRANYLVSYVLQQSDTLASVASTFGTTVEDIVRVNGNGAKPLDTLFVPVSKLPNITQPSMLPRIGPMKTEKNRGAVIGLGIGLGICGLLLILISGAFFYRERVVGKNREEGYKDEEKKFHKPGQRPLNLKAEEVNLMADVSDCLDKYKVFGISELREATDDFDDRWLIQGSVYKGCINGEWFAIKKMKWNAYEELKILQKVNHGNLVRLEGFCIDSEQANCYLVYEYLENGSLHSWLHGRPSQGPNLTWKARLRIAIDIANGLQYIHEHTRPKVVHKDIKSSNILLDLNMRAKIANFGLARSGCNAITMHIVGTQGYVAPEYLSDGIVSTRMDVFSFGVVLLELLTGREAVDDSGSGQFLAGSAGGILEGGTTEEGKLRKLKGFVDGSLAGEITAGGAWDSVMGVASVALACVSRDPQRRPSMVEIVYALCKSDDLLFDVSEDGFSPRQVVAR